MEKNAWFENMKDVSVEYWTNVGEFRAKKDGIVEKFGWDSEEISKYYDDLKELEMNNPFNPAEYKAYRAYRDSVINNEDEIILNDFLWDTEVVDFTNCLRKAGVKSFVYANESTAVMKNIHDLAKNGFVFDGLYEKYIPKAHRYDMGRTGRGIRLVDKER